METNKYQAVHERNKGPGDGRPTALQIIKDEGLEGKLSDKTIMITGCSSGLGIETARALSATGSRLILTARNLAKGRQALGTVLDDAERVILVQLDLESFASVKTCAQEVLGLTNGKLNILICNAGIRHSPESKTKDGFERQFGTNHLGHFLLFQLLKYALLAAVTPEFGSRVVAVTSSGHRSVDGIQWDNLNMEGCYDRDKAYGQSKLANMFMANVFMANEIERRYGGQGLHAWSAHPGGIRTGLQHVEWQDTWTVTKESILLGELGRLIRYMKSPEQGAATSVWAAVARDLEGRGSKYLENCGESGPAKNCFREADPGYTKWAVDVDAAKRLWKEDSRPPGGKQSLAATAETDSSTRTRQFNIPTIDRPVEHSIANTESSDKSPGAQSVHNPAAAFEDKPGSSSPVFQSSPPVDLPPLPRLPKHGTPDNPFSSPPSRREGSGQYYYAAWGSPYATPSPKRSLRETGRSESSPGSFRVFAFGESSSSPDYNRKTRRPDTIRASVSDYSSLAHHDSAIGEFDGLDISDWAPIDGEEVPFKQLLSGSRSERPNWLSDDESGGSQRGPRRRHRTKSSDSITRGWLGFDEHDIPEDLAKTPTLKSFIERKEKSRKTSLASSVADHRSQGSTDTLRPSDIWTSSPPAAPTRERHLMTTPEVVTSRQSQSNMEASLDKPLPLPPSGQTAQYVNVISPAAQETLPARPSILTSQSYQRPKKRVLWRGKACVIALPLDDNRGSSGGAPLLTPDDVEKRMKQWESESYQADPLEHNNGAFGTQSCPLYPSGEDMRIERAIGKVNVKIPNKAEWDAYVQFLAEEKLRALGVTFGDDEPPVSAGPAPGPPGMSRGSSQVSHLPISPPVPTSSVLSNHLLQGSQMFSPPAFASTNGSSQPGSFASPATPFGNLPTNMHRARQSIAFDPRTGSPFGLPSSQLTPSMSVGRGPSPQGYFAQRSGTISVPGASGLPNLGEILSPISPMQQEPPSVSPQPVGMLDQMRRQQQDLQAQLLRQQHQQLSLGHPQPMTPLFGQRGNTPEMMHPTPQGHHRNVSEALEREVDETQDSLVNSIREQLERDAHRTGQEEKTPLIDEESQHYDRKERDILKGLDLDHTDEETNPSLPASPNLQTTQNANGPFGQRSRNDFGGAHRSKPSLSSEFNVQARPFNPQAAFASSTFTFGSDNSQPSAMDGSAQRQDKMLFGSSINAAAPEFTPSTQKSRVSSSDFKFNSSSFNVEAPAFNPGASMSSVGNTNNTGEAGKIFGNVDFESFVKPVRRSKAIPIVRPDVVDSTTSNDESLHPLGEDEGGRPQPTHIKRMRRGREDGDSEVQFAPSSPHLTEIAQKSSPLHHALKHSGPSPGKENVIPKSSVTSPISDRVVESESKIVSPNSQEEHWEPYAFPAHKDAETFAEAEPSAYGMPLTSKEDVDRMLHEEELTEASEIPVEEPPSPPRRPSNHRHSKSSLSATAMPFVPSFPTPPLVTKESEFFRPSGESSPQPEKLEDMAPASKVALKTSGLTASRWASADPVESSPTLPISASSTEQELTASENGDEMRSAASEERIQEAVNGSLDASSEVDVPENVKHMDAASSVHDSVRELDRVASPSFEDIDAVMRAMDADPDLGVERLETPTTERERFFPEEGTAQVLPPMNVRSDAPSLTPRRAAIYQNSAEDVEKTAGAIEHVGLGITAPINRLNHDDDAAASDWNDVLEAEDEEKFEAQTSFFDGHVNDLVGGILEDRLVPLERSLDVIQKSLASISEKRNERFLERPVSRDSDADDEDDEVSGLRPASSSYRSRSPLNRVKSDRRVEQIKAVVREALASYQPSVPPVNVDLSRVQEVLSEMKLLVEPESLQGRTADMRRIIEDVISTHPRLSRGSSRATQELNGAEKLRLQVDGLESMLKVANERAEEEYRSRRQLEADLAEARADARVAQEEAAQQREAAEEAERSLRSLVEERNAPSTQEELESLQETVEELSIKNAAMETTLAEYRISHDQWKEQIEEERAKNRELKYTLHSLKRQIDESTETRQELRSRFERLRDDMASAAQNVARDQLAWQRKEEEYIGKNERMLAVLERETQLRENLDLAYEDLKQEHAKTLTFQPLYEQSQKEVSRLEPLVQTMREENKHLQDSVYQLERDLHETRETSRLNMDIVRKDLEADISRLQKQLGDARDDAVATTAAHQAALQEMHESKISALQEAARAREAALEEQHRVHERTLNDLRERHGRALHNSSEDRQRLEAHLQDQLALSDDKVALLEDKAKHLSQRLDIANEAARAAAEAASVKVATGQKSVDVTAESQSHTSHVPVSTIASMPFSPGTAVPDKISPQALRESIMVLQDQLQNREATIESLTSELTAVDKTLPEKLKERETEVNWLRELLAVRLDDLQDVINTLTSGTSFNTEAARDAAIRLKANLEMEQQIRERQTSGGASSAFPSLSAITAQFAAASASPRAMAAAAAWGNWRKGRDISSSLSDLASSVTATPSKSSTTSSTGGFLSGLMTPPATTSSQRMSATPTPTPSTAPPASLSLAGRRISSEARPLRGFATQPRKLSTRSDTGPRPLRKVSPSSMDTVEEPRTPPAQGTSGDLLKTGSYDDDAETRTIISAFGEEESSSSVDGGSAEKIGRGLRDDLAGASGS